MFAATEATRINAIRDRLREKADMGMLGVVAAQARVSEGTLYDWLCDPAKVPSRAEMMDLQAVLSEKSTCREKTMRNRIAIADD